MYKINVRVIFINTLSFLFISKKLYKYYESVLNSDIIDIFVIGEVNERQVRKVIEQTFSNIKTLKKPTKLTIVSLGMIIGGINQLKSIRLVIILC